MENPHLVLGNSHIVQGRQQNYVAVKRLITVHSEDRDPCKWPSASEFEIEREHRDAVASRLYSGTSEIQRKLIAHHLGL